MSKKRSQTDLDSHIKVECTFNSALARTIKVVVPWQLVKAMQEQSMSKVRPACMLKTSRLQVARLLYPTCDVTLSIPKRAAALVGREVQIELV